MINKYKGNLFEDRGGVDKDTNMQIVIKMTFFI